MTNFIAQPQSFQLGEINTSFTGISNSFTVFDRVSDPRCLHEDMRPSQETLQPRESVMEHFLLPMALGLAMPPAEIALATAGLVLAGLVKGVTGIGYATCAMPLLALAVGLEKALALVVVPAIVSNAAVLAGGGSVIRTFLRFRLLYAGILPGIVIGTALLGVVDPQVATSGLALLTLTYVALAVARPSLELPPRLERPLGLPAGIVNGVLTGLTGSQILPLVPYMLALRLDADTQVQAINLAVMIAAIALGAALLGTGVMSPGLLAMSCAGALPAMTGTLAGNVLRGLLDAAAVRRLTLLLLVLVAIGLGGRGALEATLAAACGRSTASAPADAMATCLAAHLSERTAAHEIDPPTMP